MISDTSLSLGAEPPAVTITVTDIDALLGILRSATGKVTVDVTPLAGQKVALPADLLQSRADILLVNTSDKALDIVGPELFNTSGNINVEALPPVALSGEMEPSDDQLPSREEVVVEDTVESSSMQYLDSNQEWRGGASYAGMYTGSERELGADGQYQYGLTLSNTVSVCYNDVGAGVVFRNMSYLYFTEGAVTAEVRIEDRSYSGSEFAGVFASFSGIGDLTAMNLRSGNHLFSACLYMTGYLYPMQVMYYPMDVENSGGMGNSVLGIQTSVMPYSSSLQEETEPRFTFYGNGSVDISNNSTNDGVFNISFEVSVSSQGLVSDSGSYFSVYDDSTGTSYDVNAEYANGTMVSIWNQTGEYGGKLTLNSPLIVFDHTSILNLSNNTSRSYDDASGGGSVFNITRTDYYGYDMYGLYDWLRNHPSASAANIPESGTYEKVDRGIYMQGPGVAIRDGFNVDISHNQASHESESGGKVYGGVASQAGILLQNNLGNVNICFNRAQSTGRAEGGVVGASGYGLIIENDEGMSKDSSYVYITDNVAEVSPWSSVSYAYSYYGVSDTELRVKGVGDVEISTNQSRISGAVTWDSWAYGGVTKKLNVSDNADVLIASNKAIVDLTGTGGATANGGVAYYSYGENKVSGNAAVEIRYNEASATAVSRQAVAAGGVVYAGDYDSYKTQISGNTGLVSIHHNAATAESQSARVSASGGAFCGGVTTIQGNTVGVNIAGNSATATGGADVTAAVKASGGFATRKVLISENGAVTVTQNYAQASHDPATEAPTSEVTAQGGFVYGDVTFDSNESVLIQGNQVIAMGSTEALAQGGAVAGGNLTLQNMQQVQVVLNGAVGINARGGALAQGGLHITNVGVTQFQGNYEYDQNGLILRAIYTEDGQGDGMTFDLQEGQVVAFLDSVYYGTTSGTGTVSLRQNGGTVLFSAAYVPSYLSTIKTGLGLDAEVSDEEILASSTSYVATTLVENGVLMIGDGAIYNGQSMTVSEGATLLVGANSCVTMSGDFTLEGNVQLDFTNAGAGVYHLIECETFTGSIESLQAVNLAEGLECSFSLDAKGIVATVSGEAVSFSDPAVVAGNGTYTSRADDIFAVPVTLQNWGNKATSTGMTCRVYLSANGKVDDDAILLHNLTVGSLGAMANVEAELRLNLADASDLQAGNYKIIVVLDDPLEGDSTKGNNVAIVGEVAVTEATPVPDVRIASATTQYNGAVGGTFALHLDLQNLGTGDSAAQTAVSIYLTLNGTIDGDSLSLGTVQVDTPAAGYQAGYDLNITLGNIPTGNYQIVAVASNPDEVRNIDRLNNVSVVGRLTTKNAITRDTYLAVSSSSDLQPNTTYSFTCQETFRLTDFSDETSMDIEFLVDALGVVQEGAYIGLAGDLQSDLDLVRIAKLPGGYRVSGGTEFRIGSHTLSVEDNLTVCGEHAVLDLGTRGDRNFVIENGGKVIVTDGGRLQANVSDGEKTVWLDMSGELIIDNGSLANTGDGTLFIYGENIVQLKNAQVEGNASNECAVKFNCLQLDVDNTTFDARTTFNSGTLVVQDSRFLQTVKVEGGNIVIFRNCDMSNVELPMTSRGEVQFINCYWGGASTRAEVKKMISGNSSAVTLDGIRTVPLDVQSADVKVLTTSLDPLHADITGTVEINMGMCNTGTVDVAEGDATVELWLTRDGEIGADSILLTTGNVPALEMGGYMLPVYCEVDFASVPGVDAGDYIIVARVNCSSELDAYKGNNMGDVATVSLTCASPDLAVDSLTVDKTGDVKPGESLTVNVGVSNAGNVDAEGYTVNIYADFANGGRVLLTSVDCTAETLTPGSSTTVEAVVDLPADTQLEGSCHISAEIVSTVPEHISKQENNTRTSADSINILKTLSLAISTDEIREGDNTKVVYTISRTGDLTRALTVRLSSEQASLLGLPSTLNIAAGQSFIRYQRAIVNNSTYQGDQTVEIAVAADGYVSATGSLRVLDDELPALTVTLPQDSLTEGETMTATVTLQVPATTDMVVQLGANVSGQLLLPASVTIKAGETSANFDIKAVDDSVAEIDKNVVITATAAGASKGTASLLVIDDDIPSVQLVIDRTIVTEADGVTAIHATLVRTGNMSEAVRVRLSDKNGIGLILPTSDIVIRANVGAVEFNIGVVDDAMLNGDRTGVIVGTLILESCGCSATTSTNGGEIVSVPVTITDNDGPTISLKLNRATLREGGSEKATLTVTLNYTATEDVTVALEDSTGLLVLPATITIPAGSSRATVELTAGSDGITGGSYMSTIKATADGHSAGVSYLQITDIDLPDLVVSNVTVTGEPVAGRPLTVNVEVTNQGYAATNKPITVALTLSDGSSLGTITIPGELAANASTTVSTQVTMPATTGKLYITAKADPNNAIAELNATNNQGNSQPFTVSAGYVVTAQADTDAVFGSRAVAITGTLTPSAEGLPVANQRLYVQVRTQRGLMANIAVVTDENGNFATSYTPAETVVGTYSISAVVLGEQTAVLDSFEMAGVEIKTDTKDIWELNLNQPLHGTITVKNTGNVALTNFHVNMDGVPSNMQVELEGYDDVLEAGETMTINYTVTGNGLTNGSNYQRLSLNATSAEGFTTSKTVSAYVQTVQGDLVLDVNKLGDSVSMNGGVRYFSFTITNTGAGETGKINLNINCPQWLSLYSSPVIDSLATGESATVVLAVDPKAAEGTEYNYDFKGNIKVVAENVSAKTVDYSFRFVEETRSNLTVNVFDTLSLNGGSKGVVSTARAKLVNVYDSSIVVNANADAEGTCLFNNVEAGLYYLYVNADGCAQSKTCVRIEPGSNQREIVQLENLSVSVVWDVERGEYVEIYDVEQTVDFVTNVPHADLRTTGTLTFRNLAWGESDIVYYTVSNNGLIAANNYQISFPSWDHCTFTIINDTDSIAARSEHTFMIQLTYGNANDAVKPDTILCASGWLTNYWTEYAGGTYRSKTDRVMTDQTYCPTTGTGSSGSIVVITPPPAASGTPIRPVPGAPSAPKAPAAPPVVAQQKASCIPCKANIVDAALPYLGGQDSLLLSTGMPWVEELSALSVQGSGTMMKGVSSNVYDVAGALKVIDGLANCDVIVDATLRNLMRDGLAFIKAFKSLASDIAGSYAGASQWSAGMSVAEMGSGEAAFAAHMRAALRSFCTEYGLAVPADADPTTLLSLVIKAGVAKVEEYRVAIKAAFDAFQGVDSTGKPLSNSALGWLSGASTVAWDQVSSAMTALLCTYELSGPFDVSLLLLDDSISNSDVFEWLGMVGEFTRGETTAERSISGEEMTNLSRTRLATEYNLSWFLYGFCNRWNTTMQYNELGIHTLADVQNMNAQAGSALYTTDFFSDAYMAALQQAFDLGSMWVDQKGYATAGQMTQDVYERMDDYLHDDGDDVCATVTMRFSQSVVVSREEFNGTLTINNSSSGAMDNISFEVFVYDSNGVDVTNRFEVLYYDKSETLVGGVASPSTTTPITGASLAENSKGSIYVRFTPDVDVAAEGPENYSFTGTLSYTDAEGRDIDIELTPVTLEVNPSPSLTLHYFFQQDVYSDNPYTDEIEAQEKAQLGVLVVNNGLGAANNFSMSNFSVDFVANEQGVPLEFNFVGVSVNDGEIRDLGTDVSFGTIDGKSSASAIWYFETNLQGKLLINDDMTITRTDSLGNVSVVVPGDRFSIIDAATSASHSLLRSMDADGNGKTDFLVDDDKDPSHLGDALYLDNGDVEFVSGVTYGEFSSALGYGVNSVEVTVHLQAGYNHIRLTDPGDGVYAIANVSVAGTDLATGNFWQTDRELGVDGAYKDNKRLHMLYYSEEGGDVTFTLEFESVDKSAPQVLSITGVEHRSAVTEAPEIVVTFSKPIDFSTFSTDCITLTKGQNPTLTKVDLSSLTWTALDDHTLRFDNLAELVGEDALYSLKVTNAGLKDAYGNEGNGAGRELQWTMAVMALSVRRLSLMKDRKGKEVVDSVQVEFTAPVTNLTTDNLEVACIIGGVKTIVEDLSGLTITPVDGENRKFEIGGLDTLQGMDAQYFITVNTAGLGNALGVSSELSWVLCRTAPKMVNQSVDVGGQTGSQAKELLMQFDHEVAEVDTDALTLYCNGQIVSGYDISVRIDEQDATKVYVTLTQAAPVQLSAGNAPVALSGDGSTPSTDGDWSLGVDFSGVTDIYGNVGEGSGSLEWTLDTVAPDALQTIKLNGVETTVAPAPSVLLGLTLPEAGLTVSVYAAGMSDSTLGARLWTGAVEGTDFSQMIELPYDGSQKLSIVLEDAVGNTTTSTFEVMVDAVALDLTIETEQLYTAAPESISLVFNAAVSGVPMSAITVTCNGVEVDTSALAMTQVDDTTWTLTGLNTAGAPVGDYEVTVDMAQLSKVSGLVGKGTASAAFVVDPVTSVEITGHDIVTGINSVESLSLTFSTGINYEALSAANLLPQAVHLVDQTTGETVLLDAAGFSYADNTLTWNGNAAAQMGTYAIVVDATLVTATNGAALVAAGSATTGVSGFGTAATHLGKMGESYTAPYAVDWNNDGLVDLLVGEKTGSTGKVRIYLNNGMSSAPSYTNVGYVQANGAELSVSANACQGIIVALQDLNGDGKADLVAGRSDGSVVYYLAGDNGSFGAMQTLATPNIIRAFPTFFDWNEDGVADLIIGAGDGSLLWAAGSQKLDGSLSFGNLETIEGISVVRRAAPVFADVNGDGKADLLLGDGDGNLSLYYATSSGYAFARKWSIDGVDWERSRATVADINGDGKADIIVGGSTGDVYVIYGQEKAWSSAPVNVEGVPEIPAPKNVKAEISNNMFVLFSWNTVAEASTYTIEYSLNSDFSDSTTVQGITGKQYELTLGSGTAEGTYNWRIQAVDGDGVLSAWVNGNSYYVDLSVDTVTIKSTTVTSDDFFGNGIQMVWNAVSDVSGVDGYNIQFSTSADFSTLVDSGYVTEGTSLEMFMTEGPGVNYYWRVQAKDGRGNVGEWSQVASVIDSCTAQAGVTGAELSWLEVEGASSYTIQYATNDSFAGRKQVRVNSGSSYQLTGLTSGTDYYWRVVACDSSGKTMGGWSLASGFTTTTQVQNDVAATTESEIVLVENPAESVISSTVTEYVGADDPTDFFKVTVDKTAAYDLSLDLNAISKPVYLSIGTLNGTEFSAMETVLVSAASGRNYIKNILLDGGNDYYVRVTAYNGAASGYSGTYNLTMQTELVADNKVTANNTYAEASVLTLQSEDTAGISGWVGVDDEKDIYRIEMSEAGKLNIGVSGLDYQVRLQVTRDNGTSNPSSVFSGKATTSGLDKALSVSAGTYYVQVSTYGTGNSRYNSAYMLDIETDINGEHKQAMLASL